MQVLFLMPNFIVSVKIWSHYYTTLWNLMSDLSKLKETDYLKIKVD